MWMMCDNGLNAACSTEQALTICLLALIVQAAAPAIVQWRLGVAADHCRRLLRQRQRARRRQQHVHGRRAQRTQRGGHQPTGVLRRRTCANDARRVPAFRKLFRHIIDGESPCIAEVVMAEVVDEARWKVVILQTMCLVSN